MEKTPRQFESFADIIDFAVEREREAQEIYASYAAQTGRAGFRQLLLSMAEMEKDHESRLLAIRSGAELEAGFPRTAAADLGLDEMLVDVKYSPEMEYGDFLILVIKKESGAEKLYRALAAMAGKPDLERIFGLLAEEEGRHKQWAQERYDQEILSEN